jgi:aldose 1-epimerase
MEVIALAAQGEEACLVPALGCQCLQYRVGALEVLAGPVSLDALRADPWACGMPVLYPWPGRIAGARFTWSAREHQLPVNEQTRGHALHGLVYDRPFNVLRQGPDYLQCELNWGESAAERVAWPYPSRLRLDYEIGNGLRIHATVTNTGDRTMPFGLGLHPYFRAPLGANGTRAAMRLRLDAANRWPLDERLVPAGRPVPVTGKYDLRSGRELGEESYDDAFTAIAPDSDGAIRALLIDPALRVAVEVVSDSGFAHWMIYAPGDRGVVSIEPYTCAPDAFNLAARGMRSGHGELQPGQSWQGRVEIRIAPA